MQHLFTPEQAVRWEQGLLSRRSIRTYDGSPLLPVERDALRTLTPEPLGSARVRHLLIEGSEAVTTIFKGLVGSYGRIAGAPALVAFVAQTADPDHLAALGYMGQQVVLEATALGLSTCWVGGAFRPEAVGQYAELATGEAVLCVTPVGRTDSGSRLRQLHDRSMKLFVGKRKSLDEIARGPVESDWLRAAVEAARWAPSSVNRQPWRFTVELGSDSAHGQPERVVSLTYQAARLTDGKEALDCGIAMANFAVAARARGSRGRWRAVLEGLRWEYREGN